MLVILMFHKIFSMDKSLLFDRFTEFVLEAKESYSFVLPGDDLPPGDTSICLTFDDAYFDFYKVVFPLLEEFSIPSVMAIPTGKIKEKATLSDSERLSSSSALCSWEEIATLHNSNLVEIASHTHNHTSVLSKDFKEEELLFSKELIAKRVGASPRTFVYPYGHYSDKMDKIIKNHYTYTMAIGSKLNLSWNEPLSRIDGELFLSKEKNFLLH